MLVRVRERTVLESFASGSKETILGVTSHDDRGSASLPL